MYPSSPALELRDLPGKWPRSRHLLKATRVHVRLAAAKLVWFGWYGRGISTGRWDGQAVGQGDRPTRVVALVYAVRGWGFVLSAEELVRAAGGRGGKGVVGGRGLSARCLGDTAAAEGGDAAAVAA